MIQPQIERLVILACVLVAGMALVPAAQAAPHSTMTYVQCNPPWAYINPPAGIMLGGRTTTCTATVVDMDYAAGPTTPTGSVGFSSSGGAGTFSDSAGCALSPAAGRSYTASCSVTYAPGQAGTAQHTITGTYGGDDSHASSAGWQTITVPRSTSLVISCSPRVVVVEASTTCTATVIDTDSGSPITPTGGVGWGARTSPQTQQNVGTWTPGSSTFGVSNGSCALSPTGIPGRAGCTVTYRPAQVGGGTHEIHAMVSGNDQLHIRGSADTQLTVVPAAASIKTLLAKLLAPSGEAAKIPALLKRGGYTYGFAALSAGRVTIDWYYLPRGADLNRPNRNPRPVLIAAGQVRFSKPGLAAIAVRLTAAGKQKLRASRSLELTAKTSYTPAGTGSTTQTKMFLLRR